MLFCLKKAMVGMGFPHYVRRFTRKIKIVKGTRISSL